MNYNKIACSISKETIEAYDDDNLSMFISAISDGPYCGKFVGTLPFLFDIKFTDKLTPHTDKSKHQFKVMLEWLVKSYNVRITKFEDKEPITYSLTETREDKDLRNKLKEEISESILGSNSPNMIVEIHKHSTWFELSPFVAKKEHVDIILNNEYSLNFRLKRKEDLYNFMYRDDFDTPKCFEDDNKDYKAKHKFLIKALKDKKQRRNFSMSMSDADPFLLGFTPRTEFNADFPEYKLSSSEMISDHIDLYWLTKVLTTFNYDLLPNFTPYPSTYSSKKDQIRLAEQIIEQIKKNNKDKD